jgi:NhaP-type Na+/H+ or K+/H+ antiporter
VWAKPECRKRPWGQAGDNSHVHQSVRSVRGWSCPRLVPTHSSFAHTPPRWRCRGPRTPAAQQQHIFFHPERGRTPAPPTPNVTDALISLAAVSSYVNYRYIRLPTTVGTLVSTCIVGGMTWLVLRWLDLGIPFMHALLFGALISPTDPIAVLGIMKSVGASRQLEVQMAGESLLNDGLRVVVFLVLLQISGLDGAAGSRATAPHSIDVSAVGFLLLKEVGGALVLGLAAGIVTYRMLKGVDNYQVEVLLTIALAMGLYAMADALHLSAPIAVVVAGLFVGNQGRAFAMTEKTREHVDTFWELVDEILNVVLFLLIGLELLVLPIERGWLVAG